MTCFTALSRFRSPVVALLDSLFQQLGPLEKLWDYFIEPPAFHTILLRLWSPHGCKANFYLIIADPSPTAAPHPTFHFHSPPITLDLLNSSHSSMMILASLN